ncbi:MAG: DUF177 domain-containing protein [Prevotellaceae bacterium]|jgi:uncharacterized metal-binding protein YceD (DUF177 family)|nr:DUF177 domain-containing protein [Prevotellaceae bacterium]
MFKGLSPGKHTFTFEIDDLFFALFEESEIEHGKLFSEVELEKQSALLQLDVKITGSVKAECDRCLDELNVPVDYKGRLLVKFGKTPDATDTVDEIVILDPAEDEIDLSQFLFDSINVSLPIQRIHPEGLCSKEMIEKLEELSVKN